MANAFRHFMVYAVVAVVIGTVWTFAWATSIIDAADLGFYPAAKPELFQRVMRDTETQRRQEQDVPER